VLALAMLREVRLGFILANKGDLQPNILAGSRLALALILASGMWCCSGSTPLVSLELDPFVCSRVKGFWIRTGQGSLVWGEVLCDGSEMVDLQMDSTST
jgi:hypothetical protein